VPSTIAACGFVDESGATIDAGTALPPLAKDHHMPVQTIDPLNVEDLTCSLEELERRIASDRQVAGYYCTVHHDKIEETSA
jgi:hypothetical protein